MKTKTVNPKQKLSIKKGFKFNRSTSLDVPLHSLGIFKDLPKGLYSDLSSAELKEMEDLSMKMAIYFEDNIKVSELVRWLSVTIEYLSNEREDRLIYVLIYMGYALIPDLIECKNSNERIKVLKDKLSRVLDEFSGEESNWLPVLGATFLRAINKLAHLDDSLVSFQKTYTVFLVLNNMNARHQQIRWPKNKIKA